MNYSAGLVLNAGQCPICNLIHLMAKLPGNHVHSAATLRKFVTHQRNSSCRRFRIMARKFKSIKRISVTVLVAHIVC